MFDAIVSLIDTVRLRHHRQLIEDAGMFNEEWYKLAYPFVVRDKVDPLTHFLKNGKKHRLSPSPSFDTGRYLDQHDAARLSRLNPLVHYIKYGKVQGLETYAAPPSAADRILASGLFDCDWYTARYPDIAGSDLPGLLHYLTRGVYERRSPGPNFDTEWYLAHYPDVVGIDPLLHFVDYGRNEGRSPLRPTRLIELAMRVVESIEDLEPELYAADYFEKRDQIELRNGRPRHRVARAFEAMIDAMAEPPRAIVFMPWIIHGGADLVACHAVRALAENHGTASVLVILTDHDREDAPHLLPEGVPLLSFSRIDADLSLSERTELIDLLVRGLQPDVILNVNSHACWEAMKLCGRRLSFFTRLYAMLFCPDFSSTGRRNGYSDLYLRQCLPHLSGIYFDNRSYIDEMTQRFSIPSELRTRLVRLLQPAPQIPSARHERSPGEPLRVLWAGRLTLQKNVDLLIAIAERAPQFAFHIWGGRGDDLFERRLTDLAQRCPSVKFHGPFDRFDALPLSSYDALLYTSLWDGIPNVLLEAASARLPIVASHVGGIGELVDPQTGWLIGELDDPAPYIAALQTISDDPTGTAQRGEGMRQRLLKNHNWQTYRDILTREPRSTGGLLNVSTHDHRNSDGAPRRTASETFA